MNLTIKATILTNITESIEIPSLNSSYVDAVSVCLAMVFVLGLTLNSISVVMILRKKKKQLINILILNLAIADIIYTLVHTWVSNHFFSKIFRI